MDAHETLKFKIEFAISCCQTIGGENAEASIFAYENVLEWMQEKPLKKNNHCFCNHFDESKETMIRCNYCKDIRND
jgi:hypothetical protein